VSRIDGSFEVASCPRAGGQRLDDPSSGDRWTGKAAADQPLRPRYDQGCPYPDRRRSHARGRHHKWSLTAYPMPSPQWDDRAPQAIKSRPGQDLGSAEVGVAPRPDVFVSWSLGVRGRSILVSNLFPEPPPGSFRGPGGNAGIMPIAQVVVQSPEQVASSTELLSSEVWSPSLAVNRPLASGSLLRLARVPWMGPGGPIAVT
jgi:hypothetical protein